MLFKSLFCFQGADQGGRFALVNLAAYLTAVFSYFLFWQVPVVLLTLVTACAVIVAGSAIRRINDAELPRIYSAAPPIVFAIIIGIILWANNPGSYALLLIGAVTTVGFMLPPAKKPASYVMGYHGPNTTVVKSMPISNRIEPTLVDGDGEASPQTRTQPQQAEIQQDIVTPDLVQPLRHWYQTNQSSAKGIATAVSIAGVVLASLPLFNLPQSETIAEQKPIAPVKPDKIRDFALQMPSDYYLMLDQNDGLVIHWRTSDDDNPALWSILTGKGEHSCRALVFDDSKEIRTNIVSVENGGDYYAELSPLDTKTAVKAIADKRNFTLCGYDFSLKGSRATIDGSETYYVYLEN